MTNTHTQPTTQIDVSVMMDDAEAFADWLEAEGYEANLYIGYDTFVDGDSIQHDDEKRRLFDTLYARFRNEG